MNASKTEECIVLYRYPLYFIMERIMGYIRNANLQAGVFKGISSLGSMAEDGCAFRVKAKSRGVVITSA